MFNNYLCNGLLCPNQFGNSDEGVEFGGSIVFCSNCGSKLPDGSNFCSVCGARIAGLEAPKPFNNDNEKSDEDVKKTTSVSFDWSNVKDEPHRKAVSRVHSPWGTTELSNKDFFDSEDYAPNEEYSRTMSFIDLLKKERDERAQAAAEEARQFTEKEETPYDYSAFEDAPSYYVPPLYDVEDDADLIQDNTPRYGKHSKPEPEDDFEDDVEVENETPKLELEYDDEDSFDIFDTSDIPGLSDTLDEDELLEATKQVVFEPELESEIKSKVEPINEFEDTVVFDPKELKSYDTMEIPETPEVIEAFKAFDALEEIETPADLEEPEEVPEFVDLVKPFEEEIAKQEAESAESIEDLDSEIADILAVGSGKSEEDKEIDLFDDLKVEIEPEEELEEEPKEELEKPVFEPILEPEPILEEKTEPEFVEEEETLEPVQEIELEPELPLVDEFVEEPVEEAEVEEEEAPLIELIVDDEPELIEEPAAEPVVELPEVPEEEEPDKEDEMDDLKQRLTDLMGYSPSEEEVAEATEELLIQEITDEEEDEDEELELELGSEIEETDALSVDEIERELFGETTDEDIEAEATKKIDKFYTLYKKNEEFQKLLDEEYNKLKTEDGVPHVDELLAEESKPVVEKFEETPETPKVASTPEPEVKKAEPKEEPKKEATSKAESEEKPKAKLKDKIKLGEADVASGGNKLTIVAVILAALLVIVLAMIIVMYVAPYSGLAMKIDSIIQTISSLFSSVDVIGTQWLL